MPKMNLKDIHTVTIALPANHESRPTVETAFPPFICEAITLPAYDELPYMFELKRNERIEFTLRSDTPVDVLLCNADDYELWVDSGYDSEAALGVHLEAEDVLAHTLKFTSPQDGEYAVVLMNWTECPADIAIEILDLLEPCGNNNLNDRN